MNTRSTRRYNLPKAVSITTTHLIDEYSSTNLNGSKLPVDSSSAVIPGTHDLLEIKTDLEAILPTVENRIDQMESDLTSIEQSQVEETSEIEEGIS
ncbi:hypothetical protein BDF20DRAFT_880540 [Mycotypha africana]|uniref:uncharacterized protein n=1 Tax=Mycotypha africana TaxID=64632 RepID=UPI00230119DE|nr:uncharacterized protein BDF20DRAFT_880540 [Mycotypha africana]KAI8975762.1 hypothetical protein BDF20DRAFT_880540 [Mycotypha africana]